MDKLVDDVDPEWEGWQPGALRPAGATAILLSDQVPGSVLAAWGERLGATTRVEWQDRAPDSPPAAIAIDAPRMAGPFVDVSFRIESHYGAPVPRFGAQGGTLSLIRTTDGWRVLSVRTGMT